MVEARANALVEETSEQEEPEGRVGPKRVGDYATKTRFNLSLPKGLLDELEKYATRTGRTKTDFIRFAIGVFTVLCDEMQEGHRVMIVDADGQTPLRELVLPK